MVKDLIQLIYMVFTSTVLIVFNPYTSIIQLEILITSFMVIKVSFFIIELYLPDSPVAKFLRKNIRD